jgi:hypothetical protein
VHIGNEGEKNETAYICYLNLFNMKRIITVFIASLFTTIVVGQGILIQDKNGIDIEGDTLVFTDAFCDDPFYVIEKKGFIDVINNTASTMTIGLRRIEENVLAGTGDAVCWGATCFGEQSAGSLFLWDVPDSAIVPSGGTAAGLAGFVIYHYPNNNYGESLYKYEFYDRNDARNIASVFIKVITSSPDGISVFNTNGDNIVGDTIRVTKEVDPLDPFQVFEIKGLADIMNNHCTDTMVIGLRRLEENVLAGTGDAVCWGATCFGEQSAGALSLWDVPDSATVEPREIAKGLAGFVIYHYPHGNTGTSLYQYEFYDRSNSRNIANVYVEFTTVLMPPDIQLLDASSVNKEGDTLDFSFAVDTNSTTQELVLSNFIDVYNYSPQSITLGLRREEISTVSGVEDVICWGDNCGAKVSAGTQNIVTAGSSATANSEDTIMGTEGFKIKIYPNKKRGSILYRYEIYDTADPSNTSSIYVKMNLEFATGIGTQALSTNAFNVYPNPVKDRMQIELKELPAERQNLLVKDLFGRTVRSINITNSKQIVSVDMTDLSSGIYFVGLEVNGRLSKLRKVIVQ